MFTTDQPTFTLLELDQQEISVKSSVFINLETGCVWELVIEDTRMRINSPHLSFEIVPISKTIFKPLSPLIDIEIELENQTPFLVMQIYAKNIWKATFQEFW